VETFQVGRSGGASRPDGPAPARRDRRPRVLVAAGLVAGAALLAFGLRPGAGEPAAAGRAAGAAAESGAANEPPEVARVEVTPPAPDRRAVLRAEAEARDADGDAVTFTYRWLVNGREVDETGPSLNATRFVPGDRIAVRVTPSDGLHDGASRVSAPVVVANHVPVVTDVSVSPAAPQPGQQLTARAAARDDDGDPVEYDWEWRVNGEPVSDAAGPVLPGEHVKSGVQIVAVVSPRDPYHAGQPVQAPPVGAPNQPPVISSQPPTAAGPVYVYQVVAADPDGDRLRYYLDMGPDGMMLDRESGRLEWSVRPRPGKKAAVTLRADDGRGGRAVQRFTIDTSL
jgi:hypothetical protein